MADRADAVRAERVYADFHNLDDRNRLRLVTMGTWHDLTRLGIELQDGLLLGFYTDDADDAGNPDDLLIDGIVRYNSEGGCWVAEVDWRTVRHLSDDGREVG